MKEIKITYAEDVNGNLIHINSALKENKYVCFTCRKMMSVRTSRLQPGQKYYRRSHYAHHKNSNCAPETVLHNLFKTKVAEYIQDKINNKDNIIFSWKCKYCEVIHSGNLIKKINIVKLEYYLGECIPDIALLDNENNVIAVIELVVTHKPEEKTLLYYKAHNIILIQIDLTSFDDIDNFEARLLSPDIVDICTNPKCSKCGKHKIELKMNIIDANCYKCGNDMKVVYIDSPSTFTTIYPDQFLHSEVKLALDNGAVIKQSYSRTAGRGYSANVCPRCNAFIGEHYLHEEYIMPSVYGEYNYTTIDAGYSCPCERVSM